MHLKKKRILTLDQPSLFLEFFVRSFTFEGKSTVRTELPKDAFFYTGESKAQQYHFWESVHGEYVKRETTNEVFVGFDYEKPCLSTNISENLKNKLFNKNTNTVCVIGSERSSWDKYTKDEFSGKWYRGTNEVKSNKYAGNADGLKYANFLSLAPYNFSIENVLEDGTLQTNFPRKNVLVDIKPLQTVCFLYRRVEFSYCDFYYPNLNLVLFVKNYGFHQTMEYRKPEDIARMDSNRLCLNRFDIRDFRK